LKNNYSVNYDQLSFRNEIGRFFRVYGRENLQEKKPIHAFHADNGLNCINSILKLFDKYSTISADTNYDNWILNNPTELNSDLNKVLSNFEFFKYSNYNNIETIISESHDEDYKVLNHYILRYEDIIVNKTSNSNNYFTLSTETQLSSVLKKVFYKTSSSDSTYSKIENIDEFVGAFLYPNLLSNNQLVSLENGNTKYIDIGSSVSVPIIFEYFTSMNIPSVTKSLYFDIKNSTIGDLMHYMIEVTGNYDFTTSSEVYQNVEFENIEIE
jgi:hypothetical protein